MSRSSRLLILAAFLAACASDTATPTPVIPRFDGTWQGAVAGGLVFTINSHEDDSGVLTGSGATSYDNTPGWTFNINGVHTDSSVSFTVTSMYIPFDFSGKFDPAHANMVNGTFIHIFTPTDTVPITLVELGSL